ncbi:hypothetical protein B0T25DRAFT_511354 [Lasiosphaeria hispida]|uniref:Nudix hydrolase domain-containing protein n=1 Tax=Lasiosphaeria hispida TaxID=260671 RepID=A0AAJ0H750_9PEZI|nr:hypothetical protein B0T25DRAFT_511354 [Lasiosphaeria hispida]
MPPRLPIRHISSIYSIDSILTLLFVQLRFPARGCHSLPNIQIATKTFAVRKTRQTLARLPGMEKPPGQRRSASSHTAKGVRGVLRPSASILILSPTNQVLLLRRVQTSTSFASAHVFPGGNLSSFHEGGPLNLEAPEAHQDNELYRLAAVRETFEESGIVLACQRDGSGPLHLPSSVIEAGRKEVQASRIRFPDWLATVGGIPDTASLTPFTRWITPLNMPKRFTTQMYLYPLPLSSPSPSHESIMPTPTHDGGIEHTAAAFDDARSWLARARAGEVILFPPQYYLLHLVSELLTGPPPTDVLDTTGYYQAQRDALMAFLRTTPVVGREGGKVHRTAGIPWADKVMSPAVIFTRGADGRVVLGLDKPGPELERSERGGDWERVVLVRFGKGGPREMEVRWREEVVREEREAKL